MTIPLSRSLGGVLALAALAVTVVLYDAAVTRGSDHQDSPAVLARPGADITDVFVYPNPADPSRVVLQMNVDPLLVPGAATTTAALDPQVLYQFKIAHGARPGREDMVIQFLASGSGPSQTISVYGPAAPAQQGTTSTLAGAPRMLPFNAPTALENGIKAFVGPRADPFFFDLAQFFKIIPDRNYQNHPNVPPPSATSFRGFTAAFNSANGTTCDTSAASDLLVGFNVLSIVIEAPKSLIAPSSGSQTIHVWATTSTPAGS
jgi:hypothetical protein